jgi:hypothetical protein|tara:strand:+ start:311 stop:1729 length:1419 start_codon:yes stop_codon:yes gene_type:complete
METLQRTANRGSISTGFDIDNSVKFEADNTEYMKFTSSQSGSDLYRMAFNIWLKRTELGTAQTFMLLGNGGSNSTRLDLSFDSSDRLQVRNVNSNWRLTTQVFRDTSAWYHLFFQIDTTQSTANDRIKVYVNGNLIAIGDYTTVSNPAEDAVLGFNRNYANILGGREIESSNSQMFSGYIAQVYGSGGTPPSVTDFGEFDDDSGIWKPKNISGISPPDSVNGFFLDFADASDLGNDASGNSNNFSLVNITSADQATDTPTNSFCTLNPLMANAGPANYLPITEGGTKAVNTAAAYKIANSTFGVTSGKWYWEVKATDVNGVTAIGVTMPFYWDADYTLQGCIYYAQGPQRYNNASASSFGSGYTDGDIISFALDMDATPPTMEVYKNNSSEGNLMAGLSINGTGGAFLPVKEDGYFPKVVGYNANTFECNFGGYTSFSISSAASDANGYGTFEYAPPSGYYAICTKNLAEYG